MFENMSHPLIDPKLRDTFQTALGNLGHIVDGNIECVGVLRGSKGIKVCVDNVGTFHDSDLKKWRSAVSVEGLSASDMDVDVDRGRVTFTLAYKRGFKLPKQAWPILLLLLQFLALMWIRPERYSLLL